ncbi:hypothetical protein OPT61_g965 [Boeremia exigua]|uniref:Uncharacterized protein n=1 Tax=Boeremia exigua TaxID=749465 RepID=A0ACC2IS62_9PLEO|nr:hypothetical protein OPT61_g965 [Boeremia exigua]
MTRGGIQVHDLQLVTACAAGWRQVTNSIDELLAKQSERDVKHVKSQSTRRTTKSNAKHVKSQTKQRIRNRKPKTKRTRTNTQSPPEASLRPLLWHLLPALLRHLEHHPPAHGALLTQLEPFCGAVAPDDVSAGKANRLLVLLELASVDLAELKGADDALFVVLVDGGGVVLEEAVDEEVGRSLEGVEGGGGHLVWWLCGG